LENYYDILGVAETATQDEIKKAYRQKSKEHHPDKGGNEETFKKINEAYTTLGDDNKKVQYDNQRKNPFGNNPFGDIFGDFFGGFGGQQVKRAPDKIINVQVGAVDSYLGKEINIFFNRKNNCQPCNGQGGTRNTCKKCNGSGFITQRVGNAFFSNIIQTHCNECNGKGYSLTNVCQSCLGEGRIDETKSVSVNLPKGISDGQLIKAGGMGDYSNGMFGDVIFKINIIPQAGFEKSGSDLVYNKFMSLDDFTKEKIQIPHPSGDLNLTLPDDIDTSKPLKVKGKGYQNENGDLYVRMYVRHRKNKLDY